KHNDEYYKDKPQDINGLLEDMYVPNAVKRSIFRGIAIVKDIKTIMKKDPEKIFVEMARGSDNSGRTKSRKDKLLELYKNCEKETRELWTEKLENEIENRLKSEKYFLYYSQLGRCMYSHEPISLERLTTNDYYDVDHIFPQSVTKDESIHNNKVLVMKKCNQDKGDKYPINPEVQNEMSAFWHYLEKSGLITSEKLRRLTRKTRFTDEERSGFISRQLVETRQSTKALATILTKIFPSAEIVYVKSGLVSEFRHQYELPKVRILNDYHHAKDAYLNIVIGNVYNVKFTNNPLNFVKSKERYSVNIKEKGGLLSRNIIRGDVTAWISDNNQTITNVKRQYCKNDINYVRYTFFRKGELFDQNLLKAGKSNVLIPKKSPEKVGPTSSYKDIDKYGGYNKATASFFSLIKHTHKDKELISIVPVELLHKDKFLSSDKAAIKYCEENLGLKNVSFVRNKKILKVNTLLSLDGYRVNLGAKTGERYRVTSAMPLLLSSEFENYLKRVESVINKAVRNNVKLTINEKYDKLSKEENLKLYKTLKHKAIMPPYNKVSIFLNLNEIMTTAELLFEELSIEDQIHVIYNIVKVFKEGRSPGVDLTLINGSKQSSTFSIGGIITALPFESVEIIDQSPTGLFEKSTGNLLSDEF
ncbi:MAG TPA: type II CRISPR RNA-guided endonuclease Cas9, partial [Gallicola sp.]|nr:type II CRISPR RNA-guided endonuclease Cas9 [Gallicola sp.]